MIDELPQQELSAAERYLEDLRVENRARSLPAALEAAPDDDEPEEPEEAAAMREAREALARGDVVSWGDLKRRFGLGK